MLTSTAGRVVNTHDVQTESSLRGLYSRDEFVPPVAVPDGPGHFLFEGARFSSGDWVDYVTGLRTAHRGQRFLRKLVHALRDAGHQVETYNPCPSAPPCDLLAIKSVDGIRVNVEVSVCQKTIGTGFFVRDRCTGRAAVKVQVNYSTRKRFPEPKKGFDLDRVLKGVLEMVGAEAVRLDAERARADRKAAGLEAVKGLADRHNLGQYPVCLNVTDGGRLEVKLSFLTPEQADAVLVAARCVGVKLC
jgi:hypothetical protein